MARTDDHPSGNARAARPVDALWDVLALVRFFLAMVVVAVHLRLRLGHHHAGLDPLADCSGYAAILAFLILSGFSIAHSFARQPVGFYRRRFYRIYPLYFLSIVLPLAIGNRTVPVNRHDFVVAAQNLFFLQSFTTFQTSYNPVLWTLAVEVACYLSAPWLSRRRTIWVVLLGGASAGCFLYAAAAKLPYPAYVSGGEPLLVTAWAWIAGFVAYRFYRRTWTVLVLGAFVLAVIWLSDSHLERFYFVPIAVVVSALVCARWLSIPAPVRACMSFSGDVSYPLYLFHVPTISFLIHFRHVEADFALVWRTVAVAIGFTLIEILAKKYGVWFVRMAGDSATKSPEPPERP